MTVLLALAACHQSSSQRAADQGTDSVAQSGLKGVHREAKGKPAPDATFNDPAGKPVRLADFKGKPLLINLWASWCAPCVKELPTLDQLSRSGRIDVLAISEDSGPHASVVAFLKAHGITALKSYHDPNMALSGAVGPDTVLPTSILLDSDGKEVWRYVGDLDWTSPDAAKLLGEGGAAPKKA